MSKKAKFFFIASIFFNTTLIFSTLLPHTAFAQACNQVCPAGFICAVDPTTHSTFCNRTCNNGKGADADNHCSEDDITVTGTRPNNESAHGTTFADVVDKSIVYFVDTYIIPLLYALMFLLFIFGVFRYFYTGGEENREKGKVFVVWSLIGMVAVFSVWGVINLLLSTLAV